MRRNRGWREARGSLIAFTDDDCRPAPGWLEALLEAHLQTGPETVLEGRTEPDPDEAHLFTGLARSMEVRGPNRWYPTCNLAMPRALFESLGGFDEELAFCGEDTDLGLRAERAGARLVYVDEAVVWHAVHVRSLRRGAPRRDRAARRGGGPRAPPRAARRALPRAPSSARSTPGSRSRPPGCWRGVLTRKPGVAALAAYPYVIHKVAKRPLQPGFFTAAGLARLGVDVAGGALVDGTEVLMRLRTSLRKRTIAL